MNVRKALFYRLKYLAKVPEGQIMPPWMIRLHCILFPLWHILYRSGPIHYDPYTDVVRIFGKRYTAEYLNNLYEAGTEPVRGGNDEEEEG